MDPLSSIFITPELLVRIERNQRHSIGNEKVGIESADEKIHRPPSGGSAVGPLYSIFITPQQLVRIEQNQRHSIGNEKVGIESANEKIHCRQL